MKITEIQNELVALELDAWLLYDFRGINPIAQNVAGLAGGTYHAPMVLSYPGIRCAAVACPSD